MRLLKEVEVAGREGKRKKSHDETRDESEIKTARDPIHRVNTGTFFFDKSEETNSPDLNVNQNNNSDTKTVISAPKSPHTLSVASSKPSPNSLKGVTPSKSRHPSSKRRLTNSYPESTSSDPLEPSTAPIPIASHTITDSSAHKSPKLPPLSGGIDLASGFLSPPPGLGIPDLSARGERGERGEGSGKGRRNSNDENVYLGDSVLRSLGGKGFLEFGRDDTSYKPTNEDTSIPTDTPGRRSFESEGVTPNRREGYLGDSALRSLGGKGFLEFGVAAPEKAEVDFDARTPTKVGKGRRKGGKEKEKEKERGNAARKKGEKKPFLVDSELRSLGGKVLCVEMLFCSEEFNWYSREDEEEEG
jgi:hypothetical protein